jgi:lysophospholipase L1-like esterase
MRKDNLLVTLFGVAGALCAAETLLRFRDCTKSRLQYLRDRWNPEHPWERFDPISGWELLPGYTSDAVRVNRHGFRGPDLARTGTSRIFCLGDSTTSGPAEEKDSYPAHLQKELEVMYPTHTIEVVNAGIEGHSTYNMKFRIKRLLKLKPAIILIFAGWSDIFGENIYSYRDNRKPFSSYWHFRQDKVIRSHLVNYICEKTGRCQRKSIPLSYTPDEFVPFNFEYNLRSIISAVLEQKVKPVFVTLPKLIPDDPSTLSETARKKIILPEFLEHGSVDSLLKIYRAYDRIINVVVDEFGLPLIDAEAQFNAQKRPRSIFFTDTFNLSKEGNRLLGKLIAGSLTEKRLIP